MRDHASVRCVPMTSEAPLEGRALLLALAAIALLTGMIGMHHMAVTSGETPPVLAWGTPATGDDENGSTPSPAPKPHDDHESGLLHLCLAVLTAMAMIIGPIVMRWRMSAVIAPWPATPQARPAEQPRAPPPSASARLAVLGVSRT